MTLAPATHGPDPLDDVIEALQRVLGSLMADIDDIEKRAPLVARVATAAIQAARARHTIGGEGDAARHLLAILETLDAGTPADASAGVPGLPGQGGRAP
jgi:thioredoxin-like negative regulator of GroEL